MTRAGLTSVIQSNGSLIHMYYQKEDGTISVLYRDTPIGTQGSWGGGDGTTIIPAGHAALNTSLAAVHWEDGQQEYRVFYINSNGVLSEHGIFKGGPWKDGDLQSLNIKCAKDAKITAIQASTNSQLLISVIFQGPDGHLHEVQNRNGWQKPAKLPIEAALFAN